MIERLRILLEETVLAAPPEEVHITISAGVSELDPEQERAVERLIDRADQVLYLAKNSGRNRVEVSVPLDTTVSGA